MYKLQSKQIAEYFATARERYSIMLRRKKWNVTGPILTDDDAFRNWRFCNVFREDDRVTKWIRDNVREPLRNNPRVYLAMVVCRLFNKISTLDILLKSDLFGGSNLISRWDSDKARELLKDCKPIVGAAYVVKTPDGMNKLDGVLHMVGNVDTWVIKFPSIMRHQTLEDTWNVLCEFSCIGKFMAYEIVSDLRHTYLLENASDINMWANAGPGACLGLSWLTEGNLTAVKYGSKKTGELALKLMQELLIHSKDPLHWPEEWPLWEMREVEHWLCEYAKWVKVTHLGMRMKRKFGA